MTFGPAASSLAPPDAVGIRGFICKVHCVADAFASACTQEPDCFASGTPSGAGKSRRPRSTELMTVEPLDAGGEPGPAPCNSNQEHGRITGSGRGGRQHVIDLEVASRGERNRLRVAFDERSHVL